MAVKDETILCTLLHGAYKRQVVETMETLEAEPEGFYNSYLN
jgi:hypothetical protein